MLLDIADYQLNFEIIAVLLGELVQAKKNRLKRAQLVCLLDLDV